MFERKYRNGQPQELTQRKSRVVHQQGPEFINCSCQISKDQKYSLGNPLSQWNQDKNPQRP